jgi:catechol 2,3-dioxygenase-like lactoylglutathione lyase family enzyme
VSKTMTRINKLGTVVIPVSDQDLAIAFYVETLGFEKRVDVDIEISRMGGPARPPYDPAPTPTPA